MPTPTYDGSHPAFPARPANELDIALPAPRPAWTKRQKEFEARTGLTLDWAFEKVECRYSYRGILDPALDEMDRDLMQQVKTGKGTSAGYLAGLCWADADSKGLSIAQSGADMQALDLLMEYHGVPLTVLDRELYTRARSPGAAIQDTMTCGYQTRKGGVTYSYQTILRLSRLPRFQEYLRKIKFKELDNVVGLPGALMGAHCGDGGSAKYNINLCHDRAEADTVSAVFGEPNGQYRHGGEIVISHWTTRRREVAFRLLANAEDHRVVNPRKLEKLVYHTK